MPHLINNYRIATAILLRYKILQNGQIQDWFDKNIVITIQALYIIPIYVPVLRFHNSNIENELKRYITL